MSFPSQNYQSVTGVIDYDPAADEVYPLWCVPQACEIKAVKYTVANDVAASTANYFTVTTYNGGAAGTATTTMGSAVGGTAGWTGLTPKEASLVAAQINPAAGDVITASYDETGTGTFGVLTWQIDYIMGT